MHAQAVSNRNTSCPTCACVERALIEQAARATTHVTSYTPRLVRTVAESEAFQRDYAWFLRHARRAHARRASRRAMVEHVAFLPSARCPHPDPTKDTEVEDRTKRLIEEIQASAHALQSVHFDVSTSIAGRDADLYWFVRDPLFPATLGRALLGKIYAEAAFALTQAKRDPTCRWSDADFASLAAERYEHVRCFAALCAGVPGTACSLILPEDRLDLPSILQEFQRGRMRLEEDAVRVLRAAAPNATRAS